MNLDNNVKCAGLDMRDKRDWDGEYPYYEPTKAGFIVHLSEKADLPGFFTDYQRAAMAYRKYRGKIVEADVVIAEKKAAKKRARKPAKKG